MTTVHSYDMLPPSSGIEVYLSPEELQVGALYELESDYLERIGYCIDGENFYGLHIEGRTGVFRLRISREPHKSYSDPRGVSGGAKPLAEVLSAHDTQLSQDYTQGDLAPLLVQQNATFYEALQHGYPSVEISREVVDVKYTLFSKILEAWEAGTLPPPDEHGHLDLLPLKQH